MKSCIIFISAAALLSALRILLGMNLPLYFVAVASQDDFWMVYEADLRHHFQTHYNLSLAKTMGFPVFLQIINLLHIPYRLAVSLLWVLAAGLAGAFMRCLTRRKIIIFLSYAFILFCPVAFDSELGGRLYRNAVLAPAALIFLALLLILSFRVIFPDRLQCVSHGKTILLSLLTGASFLFFYYIKEDGIWLLPLFVVFTAFMAFAVLRQKRYTRFAVTLIPILLFILGSTGYKTINAHYFGVFEINTRTESSFADFSARLFRIADENKTSTVWLPYSTFQKAWDASQTLSQYPEVLDEIKHSSWASGDFVKIALPGDFPLWMLRDAMGKSALYATEQTALDVLSIAADELDAAFEDGKLEAETGKLYLSKAANGRTLSEILALAPMIRAGWQSAAFYANEHVASAPYENDLSTAELSGRLDYAARFIHDDFTTPETFADARVRYSLSIAAALLMLYRGAAFVLIPLAVIGLAVLCRAFFRRLPPFIDRRLAGFLLTSMLLLLFSASALLFGVAWFSEWLGLGAMTFYGVAAVPALQLFELIGLYSVAKALRERFAMRSERGVS